SRGGSRRRSRALSGDGPARGRGFTGRWQADQGRSQPQDEILAAIGIGWAARMAIRKTAGKRTLEIEQSGAHWLEKTKIAGMTKSQEYWLDGREQSEQKEGAAVRSVSKLVPCDAKDGFPFVVVTDQQYEKKRIVQRITRSIVDGGSSYKIEKQMTLPDGKLLTAVTYFTRIA
ncbi:MAG: hypothetical protein CBD91_05530, partial [Phycisphaeraceae bacterium TMED231]